MSSVRLTLRQRELLAACPVVTQGIDEWSLIAMSACRLGLVDLTEAGNTTPISWRVTLTEAGEHALETGYRSVVAPREQRPSGPHAGYRDSQTGGGRWCNPHHGRTH